LTSDLASQAPLSDADEDAAAVRTDDLRVTSGGFASEFLDDFGA
jgi:hypothetical protein